MARLRLVGIGCGGRGRGHLKVFNGFDEVEIVAVCDPVEASRDKVGDELGVGKRYGEIEALLDTEKPDIAVVSTPAHLNAAAALKCFERGVHTLMEKPPGLSSAETRQLRQAAQDSGAKGMVGWNRRFHPMVVEARRLVEERGPIVQLLGQFHKNIKSFEGGRFPEIVMDNMIFETPIHAIDLVRSLADSEVSQVQSIVRRAVSGYKDVHAGQVVFENGCVAQLMANYTSAARLERYEIHGHFISAYLEGISSGEILCDGQRTALTELGGGGTDEQNRYFVDCVLADRPIAKPAADLDEAVKTMELVERILAGLES